MGEFENIYKYDTYNDSNLVIFRTSSDQIFLVLIRLSAILIP